MAMPDALSTTSEGSGARARIQRFGGYLSGMVMPNIGAFIAFGFITALFIPDGWTPNADLAEMVGPMIIVLIPTLVAYSGGRMVHGQRGAVIGAVAVFGAIVAGADPVRLNDGTTALPFGGQVMILGAFVLGPLSAYLLKLFDNLVAGRVKAGFEMLIDNFSIGILGGVMAIFGYTVIEPIVGWITDRLGEGVETLVNHSLLPLSSVIIEPAKVLFLNNAINHGVLTPLGAAEVTTQGKSILFMLEANPGPGAGPAARLHVLRPALAASDGPGRADHPVLRRHPRDLLPLRADAAQDRSSPPSPAGRRASRSSRRSASASPARRHRAASSPS